MKKASDIFRLHPIAAVIIGIALILYLPLLNNFFWSDDWYILALGDISSVKEFLTFFSFRMTELATPVYRPLSSQVFYFVMRSMFGINPLPYHLVAFGFWAAGACMLYRYLLTVFDERKYALLGLVIYVFSASHFTRLTYLSAFQEILMFFFAMLSLLLIQFKGMKYHLAALISFIAALLSKETAVVIPLLMVLTEWFRTKKIMGMQHIRTYGPSFLVLIIYSYLRFYIRGVSAVGEDYNWDFSIFRAMHTATWYGLWSIGLPEFMIDYVGSGGRIIQRYWSDFGSQAYGLIIGFVLVVSTTLVHVTTMLKREKSLLNNHELFMGVAWFVISLAPVLFLPEHKFALGQSLALVGVSFVFISITKYSSQKLLLLSIAVFIGFNIFSITTYYDNHVSEYRSTVSKNVYTYISQSYPEPPAGFVFVNDRDIAVEQWGLSRQIHEALSDHFFSVIYGKGNEPVVIYEDTDFIPEDIPDEWVRLPSSQFLP